MTKNDQLYKIFSLLGTPNDDDMSFVTDEKAIEYLSSYKKKERTNFNDKFKGISKEGVDLLDKLL